MGGLLGFCRLRAEFPDIISALGGCLRNVDLKRYLRIDWDIEQVEVFSAPDEEVKQPKLDTKRRSGK